ncbi:MAG TPA: creatininase family protein [Armatimonadota bacterium]|nr:creatininase family protein [Armatimonadota bacterium]
MKLAEMTWPEMAEVDRESTVLLAPYAACEQHGPHLPFFVDTLLCTAVAEGVERALPDRVLLLPTQWLGASAHHLPFFGTLTADLDQHIQLMVHPLSHYLAGGWKKLFILNGHGGNIDTYHLALRILHERFPDAELMAASYWEVADPEIAERLTGPRKSVGHACEAETAMMLAVRPDLVRMELAEDCHLTTSPGIGAAYVPTNMQGAHAPRHRRLSLPSHPGKGPRAPGCRRRTRRRGHAHPRR